MEELTGFYHVLKIASRFKPEALDPKSPDATLGCGFVCVLITSKRSEHREESAQGTTLRVRQGETAPPPPPKKKNYR